MTLDLAASIRDRVALVTGGSRGIGACCARALLDHGARVVLTYNRHRDEAEALAAEYPERARTAALDLRDPASVTACIEGVAAAFGGLDIVVNNAAVGSATVNHYEEDPALVDEALVDINAMGAYRVCRAALAVMRRHLGDQANAPGHPRRGKKLINLSSVGGVQVFPAMRLADNMSKAAVVYMTRQLAAELAQQPIDVFAVCPGATDTDMFRESTLDGLDDDGRQSLLARLPKGRLIRPEEVADVILFLSSGHSTVLHGAVLDLSMGLAVHPGLITGKADP